MRTVDTQEWSFAPRKNVAPWLLAAMRLAPLLDMPHRTVATMDVHDDLVLPHGHGQSALARSGPCGQPTLQKPAACSGRLASVDAEARL